MIQIEMQVLNAVGNAIEAQFEGALVTNYPMLIPSAFPCVAVYEQNNTVDAARADSSHREKFAIVTYVVEVSSNLRVGAKSQAKEILAVADEIMYSLNFSRVGTVSNDAVADASYYRITARYEAIVGADEKIYRR